MTTSRTRATGTERRPRVALPQGAAAALENWALRQDGPFSADEAARAISTQHGVPIGAAATGELFTEHSSIAAAPDGFVTPRILARRCRFAVRLLPMERELGILIPGHRFLPFMSLDGDPDELVLVMKDGTRLKRISVEVDKDAAESCVAFLGHRGALAFRATKQGRGRVLVNAFKFDPPLVGTGSAPESLLVECLEYEGRVYRVERLTGAPGEAEADQRRLARALTAVVGTPPRGPVDSRRQLLQAVVRAAKDFGRRPVGPVSDLLPLIPDIYLAQEGGDCRFVSRSGPSRTRSASARAEAAERAAGELERITETLERALEGVPRALLPRGADYQAQIEAFHWNPADRSFRGTLHDGGETPFQVGLAVQLDRRRVESSCSCPISRGYAACRHSTAAIIELARVLRLPKHPLLDQIRKGTALPAWKHGLLRLDGVLQAEDAGVRADESVRARIVWRIAEWTETFTVTPYVQKARKTGQWSAGQKVAVARIAAGDESWVTPADQEIARALQPYMPVGWTPQAYTLVSTAIDPFEVAVRLVGHPAVFWEGTEENPVTVAASELRLQLVREPERGLVLRIGAEGAPMGPGSRLYPCKSGVILLDHAAHCVIVTRTDRRVLALVRELHAQEAVFPEDALPDLLARVPSFEAALPVDLPAELVDSESPADARLRLLLTPERPAGLTAVLRVRPLPGGRAIFPPGIGAGLVSEFAGGRKRLARRDLPAEALAGRALAATIGLTRWTEEEPWQWRVPSDDEALDLVAFLAESAHDDFVVEWPEDGRRIFLVGEAGPGALRVRIEERRDWFGIAGQIDIDGEKVTLAQLLESLREGRRYVPVGEGKWVRISQLLRDRLAGLADVIHVGRHDLEVGNTAVPLVQEFLEGIGEVETSASWDALVRRFQASLELKPNPPASFHGELREYQVEGYRWLQRLAAWGVGGCLADDMGLGKTVQALAVLAGRAQDGPALVIAPTSVGSNWIVECRRFAPELHRILYRETDRDTVLGEFKAGDLVVISYGLVLRDVEKLSQVRWHTLILDEAQFIKNSRTKTAQAIRGLQADWRIALTGTPIENHLGELWSLFRAVSPGLFGGWERFREQFALPIERDRSVERRRALARLVRPFVLRRAKSQVLAELPPRTEIRLSAVLSPEERALYDDARLGAVVRLTQGAAESKDRRFQVLAALTELRQLACHPRLVRPGCKAESAKLRVFLETVDELREGGHKALVFSQFTRYLALVREALDERKIHYQYLDGATPPKTRDRVVEAFQGGDGDLFLISLKAGGTGLNLTAADYVIHLDPWWNQAVEDQATDRAHRIGQLRPVMVYRIVATGTIEEQILALHADKRTLVANVLEGTDQAGKLSTEELIELIKSSPAPEGEDGTEA